MRRTLLLIWYFLVAVLPAAWPQYSAIYNYTSEDGLPISELQCVLVDNEGYVWTGSIYGVSRFDGKAFKHYSTAEGLPKSEVRAVRKDAAGNIWLVHPYVPPELQWVTLIDSAGIKAIDLIAQIGGEGTLLETSLGDGMTAFNRKDGSIWEYNSDNEQFELQCRLPDTLSDHFRHTNLIALRAQKSYLAYYSGQGRRNRTDFWLYRPADGELIQLPHFDAPHALIRRTIGMSPDGQLALLEGKQVYSLQAGSWVVQAAPPPMDKLNHLALEEPALLHFEQDNQGITRLTEVNAAAPAGFYLEFRTPNAVSAVDRAADGTYWVATRSGLLHVFPAFLDLLISQPENQPLSDVHAISEDREGNIWFGSYNFGFSYFDGKQLQRPHYAPLSEYRVLPGSYRRQDGGMAFWLSGAGNVPNPKGLVSITGDQPPDYIMRDTQGFCFHRAYDGSVGLGLNIHGLGILQSETDPHPKIIGMEKGFRLGNVLTTVKDRYGRWWMGRLSTGIACYLPDQDTVYNFLRTDAGRDIGAMSSLMDQRGNLWFGTNRGLYFFDNHADINWGSLQPYRDFQQVGASLIDTSIVTTLLLYQDTLLLLGNRDGLGIVHLPSFYDPKQPTRIYRIGRQDGYQGLAVEQNTLMTDQRGRVWVGSDAGAHRLNLNLMKLGNETPAFRIKQLVYAGAAYSAGQGQIRLPRSFGPQRLEVHLEPEWDPVRPNHLQFSCRLSTDTSAVITTDRPMINFSSLAPGRYELDIWAHKDGLRSATQRLYIHIPGNIWKTAWPYLGLLLLSGPLIWLYFRKQQQQRIEQDRLQVQAIVNQLNPHFINNALQWIQIRVYKDKEAVSVLSKLGANIRLVFRNSREKKAHHSLSEELQLVENYLFIQKKRFGGHLSFELPSARQVERLGHIKVLLMQLQIHCENAIEHGIVNREEPGYLKVSISEDHDYLVLKVEDNGIGRRKAAELGSRGTERGTKMLERLAKIHNRQNVFPIYSRYEDDIFTGENGESYGTRVLIFIPKKFDYEFK